MPVAIPSAGAATITPDGVIVGAGEPGSGRAIVGSVSDIEDEYLGM